MAQPKNTAQPTVTARPKYEDFEWGGDNYDGWDTELLSEFIKGAFPDGFSKGVKPDYGDEPEED